MCTRRGEKGVGGKKRSVDAGMLIPLLLFPAVPKTLSITLCLSAHGIFNSSRCDLLRRRLTSQATPLMKYTCMIELVGRIIYVLGINCVPLPVYDMNRGDLAMYEAIQLRASLRPLQYK